MTVPERSYKGFPQASELLLAAYNAGINTWGKNVPKISSFPLLAAHVTRQDTANAYSNGESESIIGRAIKRFNIPRHKLVLMTKVGRIVGDTNGGEFVAFLDDEVSKSKDYVNQYGR
jgi:predicted oxidoreductase